MLNVKASDTTATITVTLSDLVVAPTDYFLFVFTHLFTLKQVSYSVASSSDLSSYPQRFNQFFLNPSVLFMGSPSGEWHYSVYQKEDNTTDIPDSDALESGKLILSPANDFAFIQYDQPSFYTAYNG